MMLSLSISFVTNSSSQALVILIPKDVDKKQLVEKLNKLKNLPKEKKLKLLDDGNTQVYKRLKELASNGWDRLLNLVNERIDEYVNAIIDEIIQNLNDNKSILYDIEVDVDGCSYDSPEENYISFVAFEIILNYVKSLVYHQFEYR